MQCFVHRETSAIGTCRACNRGICAECLVDLGHSIACRNRCEEKANVLNAQVAHGGVIIKAQKRSRLFLPIFFIFMGAMFIYFERGSDSLFTMANAIGFGFIMFGIVLFAIVQRFAKELGNDA